MAGAGDGVGLGSSSATGAAAPTRATRAAYFPSANRRKKVPKARDKRAKKLRVDSVTASRVYSEYAPLAMTRRISDLLPIFEAIAPLGLAEDWDNVGLLLAPRENAEISGVLLTIDLTEAVLREARAEAVELVLAYHPPIFKGPKRLTRRTASERILIDVLTAGLFVYSPHTALDAAPGGINEWLGGLLGAGVGHPIVADPRLAGIGAGRFVELDMPLALTDAIQRIKAGLGLSQLRVAASNRHRAGEPIRTFAVCAGAGGSVFERLAHADLLLTGEMRHHDILARVSDGMSVVVTDHTHTERGYLPLLKANLEERLPGLAVRIAQNDRDPLEAQ
jgi:dinuclear metal center YbgI/SA1388 family protein